MMDITQRHKHWIGKEYVHLTDRWGEVEVDNNDNPIMIWRNQYKYDDDTVFTKKVKLEEFYYPKEHKLLGRDQYLVMDTKSGRYRRDWNHLKVEDVLRLLKRVSIIDGWRIPTDIEFSLDDEKWISRMDTVQRLDKTDRFMLSYWTYQKMKYQKDFKKKDLHILF